MVDAGFKYYFKYSLLSITGHSTFNLNKKKQHLTRKYSMKGDKGRKKTWFKLGHEQLGATETHHTNQVNTENHYIRLPHDQHDALVEEYNDVISISDVDGKPCNVKLL